jgi:hypothetical protein
LQMTGQVPPDKTRAPDQGDAFDLHGVRVLVIVETAAIVLLPYNSTVAIILP